MKLIMISFKNFPPALILVSSLLLQGCSTIGFESPIFPDYQPKSPTPPSELVKSVGQADRAADRASSVRVDPGAWVAARPVRIQTIQKLPSLFYDEISFNRQVISLYDFASRLTTITKIRAIARTDAVSAADRVIATGAVPLPGLTVASAAAGGTDSADAKSFTPKTLHIMYTGNLKGLLDTVSARLGVYWSFDGMNIQFFLKETRTFSLYAPSGDVKATSAMQSTSQSSSQAGGSGGGAGVNSAVNTQSDLSVWSDVEKNIKNYLSPIGGVTYSRSSGTFTVSDIPDALDRVDEYIRSVNEDLLKQVVLEVNIYAVTLSKDNARGIDLNLLLNAGSNRISMPSQFIGASNATVSILPGASSASQNAAFIRALESVGSTRRVNTTSVVTTNNFPVPVSVGSQYSYIADQKTTITPNVGVTTTSTVSQLGLGLSLLLTPRVIENDDIMLQFTLGLTSLSNLRVYNSTNSRLEMPEVDSRNILQRVNLRSGETLILTGFEQSTDKVSGSGMFDAQSPFAGAQTKAGTRDVFVITVKPALLKRR